MLLDGADSSSSLLVLSLDRFGGVNSAADVQSGSFSDMRPLLRAARLLHGDGWSWQMPRRTVED